MPFRTLCVLLRRRASRAAFPRWSVRNDQPQYRATLCVLCRSGRFASSCDAELRELHSHAGACGTIISTIVRRSASYAFPDALRPLATQSVGNCIPTLERAERSAKISCGAPRRMPFRMLCVLLRRRALRTAFPRWSVRSDQPQYRATLRVVCLSGRSASSCNAERRELHSHAGAAERSARISCDAPRRMPFRTLCVLLQRRASRTALPRWSGGTISPNIVRRSASYAFPDALRPLATQSVENGIRRGACGTRGVRENTSRNYAQCKRFRHACYLAKEYSPPCSNALRYAGLPCSRSTHAVTFG